MHRRIGILIPKEEAATREEAISQAEGYAMRLVGTEVWYDYYRTYEESRDMYDDMAIRETDTKHGMQEIERLKGEWQREQLAHIAMVRQVMAVKSDEQMLAEWVDTYNMRRVGGILESPLLGPEFDHATCLKDWDEISPSWMVFLDFHY